MNKCKWNDNNFEPCSDGVLLNVKRVDDFILFRGVQIEFCPRCGASTKKPKPLIVKSGNTWVANYEGVDYLCTYPTFHKDQAEISFDLFLNQQSETWVEFDEIEITDDIALLRPMVVSHNKYVFVGDCTSRSKELRMLVYVKPDSKSIDACKYVSVRNQNTANLQICRLAKAREIIKL